MSSSNENQQRRRLWDSRFVRKGDVILAFFLRGLFLLSLVISIFTGRFDLIPIAAVSLALTFIPSVLERSIRVSMPASFQVVLLLFLFGAQFLGEIMNYYNRFWWWDMLLHGWSGVLLGIIGFLLVYILNYASGVKLVMSSFFIAFFAFCFAVACGVVWEVFEYLMDLIAGTNMQKSGLHDTMGDLIIDTVGALIISINGYLALHRKKNTALTKTIDGFMKTNPDLERKLERE